MPNLLYSQMYMRTNKNIGFVSSFNLPISNSTYNHAFSLGITKQIGAYVLPEIGYRLNTQDFSREYLNVKDQSLGFVAINFRKRLFLINKRRVGSCCKAELVEILCAPELYFKGGKNISFINSTNLRIGLGLYHVKSGYSKRSKSWTIKVEGYYRVPLNLIDESSIKSEIGIQLRILRHRIYDFLN